MTFKDQHRFWTKVDIVYGPGGFAGCMEWRGADDGRQGYGKFSVRGKPVRAIRWVYELYNPGRLRKYHKVMHLCDNPKCVRPDHLEIGTHRQNMRDMQRKGRKGNRKRYITDAQVARIRTMIAMQFSPKVTAEFTGINYSTVRSIVEGKSHVNSGKQLCLSL